MLVVFGVTAALVAYAPPIDAAPGPFSTNTALRPGRAGDARSNRPRSASTQMHLYLIDAKDGSQFTKTKELTITASLPEKQIGPLKLQVNKAGPGHYVVSGAQLTPGGTWELEITDRVSAFDEFAKKIEVPIG